MAWWTAPSPGDQGLEVPRGEFLHADAAGQPLDQLTFLKFAEMAAAHLERWCRIWQNKCDSFAFMKTTNPFASLTSATDSDASLEPSRRVRSGSSPATVQGLESIPRTSSAQLLQGAPHLEIEHGASVYRLRITASGGLILTK